MPNVYDSPNGADSPSHQPQQPVQQQQDGGDGRQSQPGDAGNANQQQQSAGQPGQRPPQQQQAHSEPLPVPGNSRVDSAPDADDEDVEPERT